MSYRMFRGESEVRAVPKNGNGVVDWIEVRSLGQPPLLDMPPKEAVRLAYLLLAEAASTGLVAGIGVVDSRRGRRKFASR